jgi:hypothetical protein
MTNVVSAAAQQKKKNAIISEKIIPGVASVPISKRIDETLKLSKARHQRIQITLRTTKKIQNANAIQQRLPKQEEYLCNTIRIFGNQLSLYITSMELLIAICSETNEDRMNHIQAIEEARNKKNFDCDKQYQTYVIEQQRKQKHEEYIASIKQDMFGITESDAKNLSRLPSHQQQTYLLIPWKSVHQNIQNENSESLPNHKLKSVYRTMRKAKKLAKNTYSIINKIRQEEWKNAKLHAIRIGKYGTIARMINPKLRSGPTASKLYPPVPGEPKRYATNEAERKEASLLTHTAWMSNPPGQQNCHFLDLTHDEVGPCGVEINCNKPFNVTAQWKYLDGLLESKVDKEIEDRIKLAHQRLPKLFEMIKIDKIIVYPFRYDCVSGEYMHPELEQSLRSNASKGIGKARATGFAIPVLGRFLKVFLDAYIIKCKLQMSLRLLDMGTENSLRICIEKPCGGIRPLTVGHDDNVYLNGLEQQAIQQEMARNKVLPESLHSYQKRKGCNDATIVDTVLKEIALQSKTLYLAVIDDDAEKVFDRLHTELQAALLMLAGAGKQGFTEWQCANMTNRTNKLITDIFVSIIRYECGLPQGNSFSVEIANLYALFLLTWWNMDPINPEGSIAPFHLPRHGYPLIAGGVVKYIASSAYVDDATRYVALPKISYTLQQFFDRVQGYCNLLADLSLVIKMGRNVNKCLIHLYNIPENAEVLKFTSIAWSFDAQGPVKGLIQTVVMRRDQQNNLICYNVSENISKDAPQSIQKILTTHKYLGVPRNAQLDGHDEKQKIIKKLSQRIGLIASKAHSITEAKISHNMIVCQVATFSPICIPMSLQECMNVDKQLLKAYQYYLKHTPSEYH